MAKYRIRGARPLYGEIEISGAKNAAVAIIPAAIMSGGVCRIENIPQISDVTMFLDILDELGADIKTVNRHTMDIDCSGIKTPRATFDAMRKYARRTICSALSSAASERRRSPCPAAAISAECVR